MPTELPLTNRDPKYFTKPLPPRKYLYFAVLFTSYIEKKARKCPVLLELSFDTRNWNILSYKTLYLLVRIYKTLFGAGLYVNIVYAPVCVNNGYEID